MSVAYLTGGSYVFELKNLLLQELLSLHPPKIIPVPREEASAAT